MTLRTILTLTLCTFAVLTGDVIADNPPAAGRTAGGESFVGRLVEINTQGSMTFASMGVEHTIKRNDLISWGTRREAEGGAHVVLADGSLLVADVIDIDRDTLRIESELWDETQLPLELLRGIVFYPPMDPLQRDRLLDRVRNGAKGLTSDQLLLDNGDTVPGTLVGMRDAEVQWQTDSGDVTIDIGRVRALIVNPSLVARPSSDGHSMLVGLRDGSLLVAEQVSAGSAGGELTLPGNIHLRPYPDQNLRTEVVLVRPLGQHVTYLSDLEPLGYKHIPFLDLNWKYGADRNVAGGMLRSGGQLHTKGLGMHSTSRLAYRLDGPYRRFEAELGIDDLTEGRGSVTYRVFTDTGDGNWNVVYKSSIVRGTDPVLPISVDIEGARRLSLIVDFADRGDELDHANWLSARLVR